MSDILDTIDNALTDFAVSNDAMRWTPERNDSAPFIAPHLWDRFRIEPR